MVTCAIHGTECKKQNTKWGLRWACPEAECDQVTWKEDQPTASKDVRDALKILMDDLKQAVIADGARHYVDALQEAIGIKALSGVTIHTIREDFRAYDAKLIVGKVPLVEIVKSLKPLTTKSGIKIADAVAEYMTAMARCKQIGSDDFYRSDFNKLTETSIPNGATKTTVWTIFKEDLLFVDSAKNAISQCKWWTDEKKYKWFLQTGERGDKTPKMFETTKQMVQLLKQPKQTKQIKQKPVNEPDSSAIVEVAPKRKCNLE